MRAKIFSFVKCSADSMVASVRIAHFLSEQLSLSITWSADIGDEPLDVLVIIGGAYAFTGSDVLSALGKAVTTASRVIWIQNDYTVIPPKDESGAESPFRAAFRTRREMNKAPVDYWTTVERMSTPGHKTDRTGNGWHVGDGSFWINWNALTMAYRDEPTLCDNTLLYYGSFRKDRVKYFDRYFYFPAVWTVISSPSKKFEERYSDPLIQHDSKIVTDMPIYLSEHGLGLYVEDIKSHTEFHSPANRFYEMLSAGLPMVFQPEAAKMMARAGYIIDDFIVWNTQEILAKMAIKEDIREMQKERWLAKAKAEHDSLVPLIQQNWEKYL